MQLGPDVLERGHAVTLEDGTLISADTFRRIACDCGLVPVRTDDEGEPLDVGRARRCSNEGSSVARLSITYGRFGIGAGSGSDWAPVDGWAERDLRPGPARVGARVAGHSGERLVTLVAGRTLHLELPLALPDDTAVLHIRLSDRERLRGLARWMRISSVGHGGGHSIYGDDILRGRACLAVEPGRYRIELRGRVAGRASVDAPAGQITSLVLPWTLR